MWLLHGLLPGTGWAAVVGEVALFAALLLHSLGFVLLFQHPRPPRHRAWWGLALLVPLIGPAAFLLSGAWRPLPRQGPAGSS